MKSNDAMKPKDGECLVLIPQGNMNTEVPGTYGWMKKELNKKKKRSSNTISSIPNFKYGYGGSGGGYFSAIDGTMTLPD